MLVSRFKNIGSWSGFLGLFLGALVGHGVSKGNVTRGTRLGMNDGVWGMIKGTSAMGTECSLVVSGIAFAISSRDKAFI